MRSLAHSGMASSSEGYCEARTSSPMPCNLAQRREPSSVICWGVRTPATTSSPCALMRYSPLKISSPVAASRVNATPVAEVLPILPNTIACTFTAVLRESGSCGGIVWRVRSSSCRTRRKSHPIVVPREKRESLFPCGLLRQL